ncbi:hypothetical protein [Maricurvus nonylphenolicus]
MGWVRIPVSPMEAAIALSILFLAVEIACDFHNVGVEIG